MHFYVLQIELKLIELKWAFFSLQINVILFYMLYISEVKLVSHPTQITLKYYAGHDIYTSLLTLVDKRVA